MAVQGSPVRPQQCFLCFHTAVEVGSGGSAETECTHDSVPQRHATHGIEQGGSQEGPSYGDRATDRPRLHCEHEEEHPHTETGIGVSGFPAELRRPIYCSSMTQDAVTEEDGN